MFFIILSVAFIFETSVFAVMPEMDFRSACEEQAYRTNGQIFFDGKECRCGSTGSLLNPFDENVISSCLSQTTLKNVCEGEGLGATKIISDGSESRPHVRCFCISTGKYLELYSSQYFPGNYHNIIGRESLERCAAEKDAILRLPSYEIGSRLNAYLGGLPKNSVPMVDIKSLESIFSFLHPNHASRTVKVVAKKKGMHGGDVFIYRKKVGEESWEDHADPVGQQLDPRNSTRMIHPFAGAFFGFEKIDDNTYTIPSLDEFKRAIVSINQNEMTVSGSAFEVIGQFDQVKYNKKFAEEGRLPASEFLPNGDETYFFHDMALHLASMVVYPPELWKALQLMAKNPTGVLEDTERLAIAIDGLSVIPLFMPAIIHEDSNGGNGFGSELDILFKHSEKTNVPGVNQSSYTSRLQYMLDKHLKNLHERVGEIIQKCAAEVNPKFEH